MNSQRASELWSVLAGLLGGLVVQLLTFLGLLWAARVVDSPLAVVLVITGFGISMGPCLCTCLITHLFPKASDTSCWSGCAFSCGVIYALLGLLGFVAVGDVIVLLLFLTGGLCACGTARLGVYVARRYGLRRCRLPQFGPADEPRCPACGYVLYFAKDQKCPECGEYFSLRQVDMRRAQWDGCVLRPWPVTIENTKGTLPS